MKTIKKLLAQISELTHIIETNHPELYKYLDETPITIPSEKNPQIDNTILADYLDSLKMILSKYMLEHTEKNITSKE